MHADHAHHSDHREHEHHAKPQSLNRLAASATAHCLTGCAIGEVLGFIIGTALGWPGWATIALAVVLAFFFGYALTMVPLVRAGLVLATALPLAFTSDTISIAVMEVTDNAVMLAVPGAMEAGLGDWLFWGALAFALAVAYVVAFPVNRYLLARGLGHAAVHEYHHAGHGAHAAPASPPPPLRPRQLAVAAVVIAAVASGMAGLGALVEDEEDGGHRGEGMPAAEAGAHAGGATGDAASGLAIADDDYALEFPATMLTVGRAQPISFWIRDASGAAVRDMDEEGGVRMHLIVVRRDLTGYQHLHPTLAAGGAWRTRLTLPEPGVYRAFADFERGGEKTVLATDLFAAGSFEPVALPPSAPETVVDGYRVALEADVQAGSEGELRFDVTRGGQPVDVEPYLGANGHLVALRAGDLAYLHVHPLEEAAAGQISFDATFPTPGPYRLFLQFKDEGRVHTAPFTLSVAR